MAANVEPDEAEAIHEVARQESEPDTGAGSGVEVAQRDFRQPRRFSGAFLDRLHQRLHSLAPRLERGLQATFNTPLRVVVEEVREVNAEGFADGLEAPFALANLLVAEQPGWIRWDIRGAVHAIEQLLGSPTTGEPRSLSGIENLLLRETLAPIVDLCCASLALQASDLAVAISREDVVDWKDGGANAEPHRLAVSISIEGLGEPSRMHVWLPGVTDAGPSSDVESPTAALPAHLANVRVDFSAHLGASDIPLADLLSLEIGDVIPLATNLSEPLVLRVEGEPCGLAEMGSARGNRAIRIIEVNPTFEDIA